MTRTPGSRLPLGLWFLFLSGALLTPAETEAQPTRSLGFHLGQIRARQLWDDPISGQSSNGLAAGVQVDIPTPARFLSVVVGLAYAQRGSIVWDTELDPDRELTAVVRSHYLEVPILGKLGAKVGPGGAYLLGGATVDLLLETQCPQDFCVLLAEDRPMVLSVTVGGGVSVDVGESARVDLEVRLTEGLSGAYSSGSTGIRYRSVEFLIRAGVPF
ncbi:MAG: PorT family protein [Gemmatimonadetes bacterium]|nr:PorT family protein [Gemmatimonadota bacterium]NNM04742.1 PorT family protein [Gemmatimonadota bacterium]